MDQTQDTATVTDALPRLAHTAGRLLLGLYFLLPGIMKVLDWDGTSAYMAAHSVPFVPVLLALTIVLQIGGALCLFANYRVPLVAFLLAGLTLVISLYMHNFWTMAEGLKQQHETQNFIKNLAIMAGLLVLVQPLSRR
ncbi:MAG: DoxX family protein [Pseudomonadota bacterium]